MWDLEVSSGEVEDCSQRKPLPCGKCVTDLYDGRRKKYKKKDANGSLEPVVVRVAVVLVIWSRGGK